MALEVIQSYFEERKYTVFREIGFVEPEKKRVRGIANLLIKRAVSPPIHSNEIPVLETRAVLFHFPHKPFSTAQLISKAQRIVKNWINLDFFLCYRSTKRRKGEFPVITQRLASKFKNCFIYSLDLNTQEIRSLYLPMELNSEVTFNANQNNNEQSRGSS